MGQKNHEIVSYLIIIPKYNLISAKSCALKGISKNEFDN